ncbi:MAG: LbtU family siderophore porin [Thermodesulfobacteriota bacterium]
MTKQTIGLGALAMLLGGTPALAADNAELEKRIELLIEQNQQLADRVQKLEGMLETKLSNQATPAGQTAPVDSDASLIQAINDHVELSGLIEVEAFKGKDYNDDDSSDITLATVEIGLDARISDWTMGHLLLLYEEGEEDDHLIVDEGTITIGNAEKLPLYLTAGKMYLPFGFYESAMVSDPLTLELGEINDSAVQVGFTGYGFYGSVYGFNGDINETGKDDEVNSWGANAGYAYESEGFALDVGMDWINNIGDTDGVDGYLEESNIAEIDDYVDGMALHAVFDLGQFRLIGEYVAALDEFEPAEIDFDSQGAEPEAMSFEVGYTTELFSRETVFALGYQNTEEALALGLPEDRYLAAVSIGIFDRTTLSFEYLIDEDYDESEGGTGDDANTATIQLAVEF